MHFSNRFRHRTAFALMRHTQASQFPHVTSPARPIITSTARAKAQDDVESEEPVRYSTSRAAQMKPSHMVDDENLNPLSRTISIFVSLSCFFLWFFVLREESDWDENLSVSLYDRIDGLEKANLEAAITYYKQNGMDATPLLRRLAEIEAEEQRVLNDGQKKEKRLQEGAATT